MLILLIIIIFLLVIANNSASPARSKMKAYYADKYLIQKCEPVNIVQDKGYYSFKGKVKIILIRKRLFSKDEVLTIKDTGSCRTFSIGSDSGAVVWGIAFDILKRRGYKVMEKYYYV